MKGFITFLVSPRKYFGVCGGGNIIKTLTMIVSCHYLSSSFDYFFVVVCLSVVMVTPDYMRLWSIIPPSGTCQKQHIIPLDDFVLLSSSVRVSGAQFICKHVHLWYGLVLKASWQLSNSLLHGVIWGLLQRRLIFAVLPSKYLCGLFQRLCTNTCWQ